MVSNFMDTQIHTTLDRHFLRFLKKNHDGEKVAFGGSFQNFINVLENIKHVYKKIKRVFKNPRLLSVGTCIFSSFVVYRCSIFFKSPSSRLTATSLCFSLSISLCRFSLRICNLELWFFMISHFVFNLETSSVSSEVCCLLDFLPFRVHFSLFHFLSRFPHLFFHHYLLSAILVRFYTLF